VTNYIVHVGDLGSGAGQPHHGFPEGGAGIVHVPIGPADDLRIGSNLEAP
jgi:hypothetical protein